MWHVQGSRLQAQGEPSCSLLPLEAWVGQVWVLGISAESPLVRSDLSVDRASPWQGSGVAPEVKGMRRQARLSDINAIAIPAAPPPPPFAVLGFSTHLP